MIRASFKQMQGGGRRCEPLYCQVRVHQIPPLGLRGSLVSGVSEHPRDFQHRIDAAASTEEEAPQPKATMLVVVGAL